MNLEKNKKTILEIITFTILFVFACIHIKTIFIFLKYIVHLFMPFILGVAIAFVLNILLNVVEKKWFKKLFQKKGTRLKRPISIILALAIICFLFGLILFLVVPEIKNAVTIFVQNLPGSVSDLTNILKSWGIEESHIHNLTKAIDEIKDTGIHFVKNNTGILLSNSFSIATSLVSLLTNILLALVFALYILAQKEKLKNQLDKVMRAYLKPLQKEKINSICTLANRICSNFISGQCLEALIIGILCFVGMLFLRLPYATTISVLVGFTALIPVFGAFIGTIIGAFLIFMISPIQAILFILFILILQQIEGNLIYPKVVGKSVGLPGIWVMVAVTIGASVGGILGMFLSVPFCSILYSIFVTNVHARLQKSAVSKNKK